VKVGQALRILPALEAVFPLRSLLLASAHSAPQDAWGSGGPYLTIGKHDVDSAELRSQFGISFRALTTHLSALYNAFADALDLLDREEHPAAVERILDAGRQEERVGRIDQAQAWYRAALQIAEPLQDHRPEIDALLTLGELSSRVGLYRQSARVHQRALALAEAAFYSRAAALASAGLGTVATAAGDWRGAQAWYERALVLAEAEGDASRTAAIHHAIGGCFRRKGDFAKATAELGLAREAFETLGQARELAEVLQTEALLLADRGALRRAAGTFREALAWDRAGPADPALEVDIRIHIARLRIDEDHLLQAEDELRHSERIAIQHTLIGHLVEIYAAMGTVRGLQEDDSGFVFFEQAIQLLPMVGRSPVLEARLYHDYGAFMKRVGRTAEAHAHFDRARELFDSVGAKSDLRKVEADLVQMPA
jgi:tetratricopeptide (TPR) repeat protein